tara:strand:- start:477 stop:713 length:237 start_codon:yes stop_codon:yes gene_type:complete
MNNQYRYTTTELQSLPPSFGGNNEYGSETITCFSPSPKKAVAMEGTITRSREGVEGVPVLLNATLVAPNGRVVFDRWD